MCDEMHLKNGIYTNIQTGRTVGFAKTRPNALELVDIIQEIMDFDDAVESTDSSEESINNNETEISPGEMLDEYNDGVDNEKSPSVPVNETSETSNKNQKKNLVTQVNLWKFRTIYNKTRNCKVIYSVEG